ncbi:hypothetical protein [Paraburkholderia kururiensis]|uniref:hypothetical protein n=1 Tax=Paraburkholderia kururiensis TaxID=984307 RepID=UPI000349A82F|nr:hypothetical protein [Paraburkholderia kururiensis]
MADQVTIANLALAGIGTRSTISSLQEGSAEALAISLQWDAALDATLRGAHWNFARKQASLALLNDATQNQPVPTPWQYEYALPPDCLLARFVMPMVQSTPGSLPGVSSLPAYVGPPVRFLLGVDSDASGNDIAVILTNQASAILVYTKRITNPQLFDAEFVQAFAATLSAFIAIPLTGDKSLAKMRMDVAQEWLFKAQARNGNEGLTIVDSTPDWMRVRGYASDWAYPDGGYFYYGPQALTIIS